MYVSCFWTGWLKAVITLSALLIVISCSNKKMPEEFQENQPADYRITELFDGYGALEDAYDSIDSYGTNTRLRDAIDNTEADFEIASYGFSDTIDDPAVPLQELIRTDLAGLAGKLVDPSVRHHEKSGVDAVFEGNALQNRINFYAFLDNVDSDGVQVPDDYLSGMLDKLVRYALSCVPLDDRRQPDKQWLKKQVDDLKDDIQDVDFQENFVDITKLITKLLIQIDSPLWVDDAGQPVDSDDIYPGQHKSLSLGNAVRGTMDMVTWLNRAEVDPETRELLHGLIKSAAGILDPAPETELGLKSRRLVENLEDYFTIGGDVYDVDPVYSENSAGRYSDSELGQLIRDALPLLKQLFVRSDRRTYHYDESASEPDKYEPKPYAIIETTSEDNEAPVYPLELMVENLRNIGFDPDVIDVERSIGDLLRHDLFGRDRTSDPAAFPVSMLESLFFLTHATSNHGWNDGGITGEVTVRADARRNHGHGTYTEDLTLNDSLFSMKMLKTLNLLGLYELGLNPNIIDEYGNHIYRTRTPFSVFDVDNLHAGNVTEDNIDYRFFYDQNYGVLQFLAGPGAGDLGTPDGGNPDGNPAGAVPADLRNRYYAYAPNGLHETQLSAWTMGWGIRACFKGEGPYYYADPDAQIVTVNGESYYQYMRPDGRIYAFVSLDHSKHLYPSEEGDVEDPETEVLDYNGRRQRDNRYKSQWFSDYYMGHYTTVCEGVEHYFTLDNSDAEKHVQVVEITPDPTAANDPEDPQFQARRLVYKELIEENDPDRACQSKEEAFFRNYQWVMNEKKMVLVIPIYMYLAADPVSGMVFQILECHGWSGLANIRKYRDNHVWAKKNDIGESAIPGDYRISVVTAAPVVAALAINDKAVYNDNIDCGNATPSIVGHNLPALYRLAFPLSPAMDRLGDGTVIDYALGSKEFEVGDENWQRRNAFMPILFSLLAGLREYTPPYDPDAADRPGINSGMRTFLNQTAIWIKPLFYYNKTAAVPNNTWVPRVTGTNQPGDAYQGLPFLKSSADFYDTGLPETYYGSDAERAFYQPAPIKTLLNVMIDSDLTTVESRHDGILPLAIRTRTLTNLLKLLLHPPDETEQTTLLQQFLSGMEQIVTAMTSSKGPMTKINASPESGKDLRYPDWMFSRDVSEDDTGAYVQYTDLAVRQDNIDLDEILDFIIGHDTSDANGDGSIDPDEAGEGLADFPDCRGENSGDPVPDTDFCKPHADEADRTWEDFYDLADTLGDLLHEDSSSAITQNLIYILDRIFARDRRYTSEEISGMLYSFGKLFGYYDATAGQWIYQGQSGFDDAYNALALRVPSIHDAVIASEMDPAAADAAGGASAGFYGYGDHYYSQLMFIAKMTGSDDLIDFLLNTVTAPQTWGVILEDTDFFLSTSPDIIASDSELWPTLVQLLMDMGKAVGQTQNSDSVNDVITDYGFQVN